MKRLLFLIFFLFAVFSACSNSSTIDREISRYRIELKKEKISCLFDSLNKYLPTAEERKNSYAQRGAAEYLDKIKRYDQPYSITYKEKKFYIDFTLYANEHNISTFYLEIAGESEFVDPFAKEINSNCKTEGIVKDQTENR
ncbi:MAG: hypothetical protein MUP30_07070 [Deltaproteobacteria bacterium]|nr:hypothetical protein [Deltaproteobacteria bacterium]